jgi:hypothetical protein
MFRRSAPRPGDAQAESGIVAATKAIDRNMAAILSDGPATAGGATLVRAHTLK